MALGVISSERFRTNRTSDIPVASGSPTLSFRMSVFNPDCQGRCHRPSVKMGRLSPPGMPSIDKGHSRTRANRCRFRVRSREVSATTQPSAPLRPWLHARNFRSAHGYRGLGSRPRASSRSAIFSRGADTRFSEPGCRLSTSATYFPTHGHTLEHPILALPRTAAPFRAQSALVRSRLRHSCFRGMATFPSRRRIAKATSRDSPSDAGLRRCKLAAGYDTGNHRPIVTPLAGDASIRPPLAAVAVGR